MCRTGGRRCPSYVDPALISERNARRRAAYKAKANSIQTFSDPEFLDLKEYRKELIPKTPEWESYIAEGKKFSSSITAHESDAIYNYTDIEYGIIRDYLNGYYIQTADKRPFIIKEEHRKNYQSTIDSMDSALRKAGLAEKHRTLYRGLSIPEAIANPADWLQEHFPVGGVMSQKSYMSTSLSAQKAGGFAGLYVEDSRRIIIEILSRKGAVLDQHTSIYGQAEREVLLPREAKFKVVAIHKDADLNYESYSLKQPVTKHTFQAIIIQLVDADEEIK